MTSPVVTVDGPAGVGKGTLATALARSLGFHYLDSGAIYRALAYAGERQALSADDSPGWVRLALSLQLEFPVGMEFQACLDGKSIEVQIRTEECAALASRLAADEAIRQALLATQRRFLAFPGLVAEGRDMGTVVFPQAECKIFLTATPEERAKRRYKQLKEKGIDANFVALLDAIRARDERDETRKAAPLVVAEDAMVIDTSHLSAQAVLKEALLWCKQKHITD